MKVFDNPDFVGWGSLRTPTINDLSDLFVRLRTSAQPTYNTFTASERGNENLQGVPSSVYDGHFSSYFYIIDEAQPKNTRPRFALYCGQSGNRHSYHKKIRDIFS